MYGMTIFTFQYGWIRYRRIQKRYIAIRKNLHSNMVGLDTYNYIFLSCLLYNLHSNMVGLDTVDMSAQEFLEY